MEGAWISAVSDKKKLKISTHPASKPLPRVFRGVRTGTTGLTVTSEGTQLTKALDKMIEDPGYLRSSAAQDQGAAIVVSI
jgi:hypothetical protein